ncbi:MAG TPA: diacylglycerol kinase family protein [Gaiellaceae bacterium]|nr:diacylglycerol kinase family protein [Gaiellaceae bacterium]
MSETVFLVNPASDNGSTGRRWPQLARRAAALGLDGDALFSERPEHLRELARQAAEDGARLIVAVGGDGTLNEVASGVAGLAGVELAVIPRGTGVDFVRTYGIPAELDAAVGIALSGRTREIDAGRVSFRAWSGDAGEAWFFNVAGVGMSGAVARRTNESTKRLGGKVSYLWATLAVFARWKNTAVEVSVDGQDRHGRMHEVIVANGRYLGGGMMMCPEAEPDDGLFDVLLIGDLTKRDLIQTMPKLYRGTHLPHPKAELLRGTVVDVDAEAPLPVQLDGEQPGTTPVRFELVPRALRLRVA